MSGGIKRDKYDDIFSLYIRCRDNFTCTHCGNRYRPPEKTAKGFVLEKLNKKLYDKLSNPAFGSSQGLHCSHFWGRANKSVRYDEQNADSHCYGCHQKLGANPAEFTKWKKSELGSGDNGNILNIFDQYFRLEQRKNTPKQYKKWILDGKKCDMRDEEVLEYYKEKIRNL